DNGVGIEPELLPDVFDMFVQGTRGPDRAEGGLGLGLSLVRSFTELHGGLATAHSEGRGKGSEFTVRLPVARPQDRAAAGELGAAPPASITVSKRVLVVDDNRDAAELISAVLG